jgi:hypothetical protein
MPDGTRLSRITPLSTLLIREHAWSPSFFEWCRTSDGSPLSLELTLSVEEQVAHNQKNSE